MRCPSCGAETEASDCCNECGLVIARALEAEIGSSETDCSGSDNDSSVQHQPTRKASTLIKFPGVTIASVPEWRKELSERVREVQERRARDEAAEAERRRLQADAAPPQLELLPQATIPAVNPLVAAALKRIERAHQGAAVADTRSSRAVAATAVAYAPVQEESDPNEQPVVSEEPLCGSEATLAATESISPKPEKSHNLVMVVATQPSVTKKAEPLPPPKRLIRDDPNDPALNYLDSISKEVRVEEVGHRSASILRRLICAVLDLLISAFLCSPIIIAVKMTSNDFRDVRTIALSIGVLIVITFIYLTLSVALTGRTWGMRSLSLHVIDIKTGLIPTGGQSAGRALVYLISLAAAGLGILYVLLSREGYTVHDRLTRTAVIAR